MTYDVAIGLEVHVQLKTRSKLFCGCSTEFGSPPNSQVCPVCLGYPGVMPVLNEEAIRLTVLTGLMAGCRIREYSTFDRKSYFYPDMPKNYQISQYDKPLCEGGAVQTEAEGRPKTVRLTRIHLEEDVGKNMHFHNSSGVDFNRAGVPLMEIVTMPDLTSPEEAFAFLLTLRQMVRYVGASECNLEQGNMRCDVNVSIRPAGQEALGTKAELKNLNTFKGILGALKYEISRQIDVVESGGRVQQETRRWDPDAGVTASMRSKEEAHDYRYFPEPDLMPVALSREQVEDWRRRLPELPRVRRARLVKEYGIPDYDSGVLVADKAVADFFESAARLSANPKTVSNWIMTEMLRLLSEKGMEPASAAITPQALADLIRMVEGGAINSTTAKEIFDLLFEKGGDPNAIAAERGLAQVSDAGALERLVDRAIVENARSVEDYRRGKKAAAQFLVGQVMRMSQGKANPQVVRGILDRRLEGDKSGAT